MAVPYPLQAASFAGIPFYVEASSRSSGRRIVPKEYPKLDTPYAEDMGRRIRKFAVTAYIIYSPVLMSEWETNRDALRAICEAGTAGVLMLPTMSSNDVMPLVVDTYSMTEHQEKGGYCEFSINFVEQGQQPQATPSSTATAQTVTDTTADVTPNTVVSNDFADGGFDSPVAPSAATPNAVVSSDFSALGSSSTPNSVVSSDFSALGASNGTTITPATGDEGQTVLPEIVFKPGPGGAETGGGE
jgi:hypothetical protein